MTTQHERRLQSIVETDRRAALRDAEDGYIAESCEHAPLSYAALRELRGTPALGELLAMLPDELVRPQAVRFLVERRAETGALWGWGDVDEVERIFRRVIAAARAAALVAQVGEEAATRIGELLRPAPVADEPECRPDGQPGAWTWAGPTEPEPGPDGGVTLPAPALVRDVLARLATTAQAAGDTAHANAFNRADYQISRGIYPTVAVSADGTLLVPSKENAGTVYRVGETGCSCTAGANGRPCWHGALAEALAVARDEAVAQLDDEAGYRHLTQTTDRMVA